MFDLLLTVYIIYASYTTNLSDTNNAHTQSITLPPQQAITFDAAVKTPEPKPSPILTPVPTPVPAPQDDNTPVDYVEELKKLGFIRDEYEDKDLNTRNGVLRFQAAHNLVVDGDFGENSMAALKKRMKDSNFQYPDTVDSAPVDGKWITINKSKRILTLYEGKKVLKKFPVAVGNPSTLTPSIKDKIIVKIVNPYWGGGGYAKPVQGGSPYNPLGYRWMGLSLNGGGDYGVHGNSSPYSIGTDASHGCVRMINADVEELFELISINTDIWINTDEGLKEWGVSQKDYAP